MSIGKVLGIGALVLIALAGMAAYFLLSNLDGIIKDVIEDVGSEVVQSEVSLVGVELDLRTGAGRLKGLTIANPAGFDSEYAFKLDDIVVAISPASLTEAVIVISEVTIDGASLIAEQKGTKTNIGELLKNLERSSSKTDAQTKGEGSASQPRLMIEKFAFINTQATVISEVSGENSLKVPDVRRNNIGNREEGLTPQQLTGELLQSVVAVVQKAVGKYLGGMATDALEKKLTEKLSDGDKLKLEGLKSMFKKDK